MEKMQSKLKELMKSSEAVAACTLEGDDGLCLLNGTMENILFCVHNIIGAFSDKLGIPPENVLNTLRHGFAINESAAIIGTVAGDDCRVTLTGNYEEIVNIIATAIKGLSTAAEITKEEIVNDIVNITLDDGEESKIC